MARYGPLIDGLPWFTVTFHSKPLNDHIFFATFWVRKIRSRYFCVALGLATQKNTKYINWYRHGWYFYVFFAFQGVSAVIHNASIYAIWCSVTSFDVAKSSESSGSSTSRIFNDPKILSGSSLQKAWSLLKTWPLPKTADPVPGARSLGIFFAVDCPSQWARLDANSYWKFLGNKNTYKS